MFPSFFCSTSISTVRWLSHSFSAWHTGPVVRTIVQSRDKFSHVSFHSVDFIFDVLFRALQHFSFHFISFFLTFCDSAVYLVGVRQCVYAGTYGRFSYIISFVHIRNQLDGSDMQMNAFFHWRKRSSASVDETTLILPMSQVWIMFIWLS